MNRITKILLGLALIYIPASSASQCFSETLKPSYPCCKGDKIVYTDESGDWGVENGKWCGIGSGSSVTCFSNALGYPCCKGNKVVVTDESGKWGVENGRWCGIIDNDSNTCFSVALGYPCCETCEIKYTDESGDWGKENKKWCGIKDSCTVKEEPVEEPVKSNEEFDFAFLKLENNKKNMLYSPLSIRYALNMLQEGASNNTYAEINKVIGNDKLTKYESIDKNLSLANGLFIRDSFYDYVKTEFIDTLKEKYDAAVVQDEFKDATNVNQWIEDKTLGIIKNMLKDEIVQNPYTVMLLINALAIDMEWILHFDTKSTTGNVFYKDSGEEMIATTMSHSKTRSKYLSYYLDDDITVLTMDLEKYGDRQFEFMAIMPKEDLSDFVNNVTKEQISKIDENLTLASDTKYGVNVEIPKFKFNYNLKLKKDLQKLGINEAFIRGKADLSKMSKAYSFAEELYVEDALHKADIEFSEEGVKAAAVTVILIAANGFMIPVESYPIDIIINKPFMFVIRDKETKDIWFTGTVYEPNLWENDKEEYSPY